MHMRRTELYITVQDSSKIMVNYPIRIWMIFSSGGRALLVSGEDEKEDPSGFCSLETEKRRRACMGISMG